MQSDSKGNVFVSDSFNHRILKYDANGSLVSKWEACSVLAGRLAMAVIMVNFFCTRQLAVDRYDNVYVADSVNHRFKSSPIQGRSLRRTAH